MDYSGTVSDFGGGERGSSLSSLTTELGDHRHRLPGLSPGGSGGMGLLLAGGPMRPCRSASEMDLDLEDDRTRGGGAAAAAGGPMKLARTDSFPCRQQPAAELKMQMANHLVRSSSASTLSAACSPTNSSASDGTLMTHDGSIVSEHHPSTRLIRTDSLVSAPAYSFHQPYHYKPTGMALSMGPRDMGVVHGAVMAGSRPPFSASQWQELEHQALIFKYMMAGVPVPPDLLIPIRKSLIGFSAGPHHPSMAGWAPFHLGYASNMDPEPGRCRRTDGKKWRCAKDVVPDQKYCERHMHRGRHRSRKPVEGQGHAASSGASAVSSTGGAASSLSLAAARTVTNLHPSVSINNPQQQQQQHQSAGSVLGVKSLSGMMSSGNGSHFHQYPLHVNAAGGPSSPSLMASKDYRIKGDIDEAQILFSEASGSTINSSGWRSMACKATPSPVPQPKTNDINGSSSSLHYNSPQLRTLLGQDFGLVSDAIPINSPHHQQQHHQHSFLSSSYGTVDSGGRPDQAEGQPLRHFFDDWPRSTRDPSAISWSDVEDDRSNRSSSTTQLSISIPMAASSDFSATNSNSSPRGKLSLSPLKLSMSRDGNGDAGPVAGTVQDPIEMGLGVGMNIHEDRHHRHHHHHQHHQWIPNITLESPMGGPLAEVLQSSTTTPRGCSNSKSGLKLMNDHHGWNNNASSSPDSPPRLARPSPTERGGAGRVSAIETPKAID